MYVKGVIFDKDVMSQVISLEIWREQAANFITKRESVKYTKVK